MTSLAEIQSLFAKAMNDKASVEELSKLGGLFDTNSQLEAHRQIEIYRYSVMGCMLLGGLKLNFPLCLNILTEHNFNIVGAQYLKTQNVDSPDVNKVADGFPQFLAEFEKTQSIPYLSDLAKLELARRNVFSAKDEPTFNFYEFQAVSAEHHGQLIFQLAKSIEIIDVNYVIDELWIAMQEPNFEIANYSIKTESNSIIVYRQDLQVRMQSLNCNQQSFLKTIQTGVQFGQVCEQVQPQLVEQDMSELLVEAIQQGWIIGFKLGDSL